MIKFASELVAKPVLLKREKAIVGVATDIVLNPDNGKIVGILVREGFGKKHLRALPEKDILGITSEFYLVSSYEAIGEIEDIVRIKQVIDRDIPIVGQKAYTVSGRYLGTCRDYTLNMKSMTLDKIYVNPPLFSGVFREYAIALAQIVSIEKDKITVADAIVRSTEPVKGRLADTTN